MTARAPYTGMSLFSYGFRPFFLVAVCFGLVVVPVWLIIWRGALALAGPFAPVDWHIHEMIFGYGAAVVAGFLFTAVPNWTGRLPTRGGPLMALVSLWLVGRLAVWGLLPGGPMVAMLVDSAFLVVLGIVIAIEIVAGRSWRNLMVVFPVSVFAAANITFHLEVMWSGEADLARRLGLSILLFLITVIGGRIIPSFTRNWLAQRRASAMPALFGHFDRFCLLIGGAALICWTGWPGAGLTAALMVLAGGVHFARLTRWQGRATFSSPLLAMLHVAYAFIPLGFVAAAAGAVSWLPPAAGYHLLGIGAVGGMTVAVMMRATCGHTGRALVAGPWLSAAFAFVILSAIIRAAMPDARGMGQDGIALAAVVWTVGFALLCARLGPWLVTPNVKKRQPSRQVPE